MANIYQAHKIVVGLRNKRLQNLNNIAYLVATSVSFPLYKYETLKDCLRAKEDVKYYKECLYIHKVDEEIETFMRTGLLPDA